MSDPRATERSLLANRERAPFRNRVRLPLLFVNNQQLRIPGVSKNAELGSHENFLVERFLYFPSSYKTRNARESSCTFLRRTSGECSELCSCSSAAMTIFTRQFCSSFPPHKT